jgi:uncharacterized protein YceH (UPF0502 family)
VGTESQAQKSEKQFTASFVLALGRLQAAFEARHKKQLKEEAMNEFAAALNKQHRDEMAAMSSAAVTERVEGLERRVAQLEAQLIGIGTAFERANAVNKALWEAPVTLPPAPAADTDPAA